MEKQWKQWQTLFSWAPKSLQMMTAAMKLKYACSLEEKLWHSNCCVMLKSRDIFLSSKVCIVKTMVFPVMHGCESWTIKKDECQKTDAFELCCWRRLLRVLWTENRSSQSILKEINSEYSLEGLMLRLQLQYFSHLKWRANSLENILILEKIKHQRRRGQYRMRWLDSITNVVDMNIGSSKRQWCTGKPGLL